MTLAYRAIVAIIQLIFFVPGFCCAILLASRHGIGKSAGWYFLIAFTLLRIVGAICEIIATVNFSVGVYIAALVCSSIGLAPLTLLCLGLLARVNNQLRDPIPQRVFKYISLLSLVGLILGIVGGSRQDGDTSTAIIQVQPEIKAAIIIFLVVYLSTVVILGYVYRRVSQIPPGEKRILVAVALSFPFIAVRLVYALISDFAGLESFSLALGNTTIYLCMAVIMEIIVMIIIIAVGLTLRVIPRGVPLEYRPEQELHVAPGKYSNGEQAHFNRTERV